MKYKASVLSILSLPRIIAICCLPGIACVTLSDSFAATVVQRGTTTRTAPRMNNTNRIASIPTMVPGPTTPDPIEEAPTEPIIENKSSQFDQILDTVNTDSKDIASDARADMIQRQRAALDAADALGATTKTMSAALATNKSTCDGALRTCMREKCGNDFSKCAGDGDTLWGDKMDACRRNITCSGEEYRLFAAEIKADRDFNAQRAAFDNTRTCGNDYNKCLIAQCGTMFDKCIGKTAGDAAIDYCSSIAKKCQTMDNGFASRTMQVFATLRNNAEVQVKKDEARLYELRDKMTSQCNALGAIFDQRSLDCVFTVNFFANNSATPYASKKAYGGNSFNCDQNWFGVDITTFKENAYRLTREQTSATSSMLGSGLGVAAGALTSGTIGRAVDAQKAKNAAKQAEGEHKENFGDSSNNTSAGQTESKDPLKQAQDKQTSKLDDEMKKSATDNLDKMVGKASSEAGQKNIDALKKLPDLPERKPAASDKSTKSDK